MRNFIHHWILLLAVVITTSCATAPRTISPTPGEAAMVTPQPSATALLPTSGPTETSTTLPMPAASATFEPTVTATRRPVVLIGAGDISICGQEGDEQTARLLDAQPDAIFTAGDNSNEDGSFAQYVDCFDPSWGAYKALIHPVPGNHDYGSGNVDAYFDYFGAAAGPDPQGYYSYDLGAWHIVALNSNCQGAGVGGCSADSAQVRWLREDLAANASKCTLAYWHHPRWSSGFAGNQNWLGAFWDALYEGGAEVVINGDEHHYERFAPQDPSGAADPERGIREFVVGIGGVNHLGFNAPAANSEVRSSDAFGVIRFTLYPDRYEWQFVPVEGETFSDAGGGVCH